MTAHIMGVTATPNPHVSIIMSRVVNNMNPINLAVLDFGSLIEEKDQRPIEDNKATDNLGPDGVD